MAANYDDVLAQLRGAGLLIDHLVVGASRPVRCKVEGEREKRGWYSLHELHVDGGEVLLVGSFGVWRGMDNGATKIELRKRELSSDQREALRARLAEDRRQADLLRKREADRAAAAADKAWKRCAPTGDCDYLARKGVGAHGVRFSPGGSMAIPVLDVAGQIHGLQVIRSSAAVKAGKGLGKEYWPKGMALKGHFHLLGMPTWIILVTEGYATGATIHEATGLPTVVAFDAGNIPAVVKALGRRYPGARILICADDDEFAKCRNCRGRVVLTREPTHCPHCHQEHRAQNAGVTYASAAALECGGAWVRPIFTDSDARTAAWLDRGSKLTDFNDLHAIEGLHVVRAQIEARLSALRWSAPTRRPAGPTSNGGEGKPPLAPIAGVDELLSRFCLVYGKGGTLFDRAEHTLVALSDMRDACMNKYIHRAWQEHPERVLVRPTEVGFDPAGEDPNITCNLWGGWPTTPKAGSCQKLLDLLGYMCSDEDNFPELFEWVKRWIAYPIQHPGAKMKTTLVLHGPQGTGKNMFFEALMAIYSDYGRVIDQAAIEDKFNDWASRKLFLIADEVVARSDLYHVKNKLKAFISGDWIRINPKQIQAYDERNHVNMVFLSNETVPVVLEEDDRRYAIIWTPKKHPPGFYQEVKAEIDNGGIEALHDYLLNLPLGDFRESTLPPDTASKRRLIGISLDSTSRFFYDLARGDIGDVRPRPALSEDVYDLYKTWCIRGGHRAASLPKLVVALELRHEVKSVRKRYTDHLYNVVGPRGVLMLGRSEMPPGVNEHQWLGEQIQSFRRSVDEYKGQSHG